MSRNILCVVEFDKYPQQVVKRAAWLAKSHDCHLHLLVSWRRRSERALQNAGPFALISPKEAPIDTPAKKRGLKVIARMLIEGWKRGPS